MSQELGYVAWRRALPTSSQTVRRSKGWSACGVHGMGAGVPPCFVRIEVFLAESVVLRRRNAPVVSHQVQSVARKIALPARTLLWSRASASTRSDPCAARPPVVVPRVMTLLLPLRLTEVVLVVSRSSWWVRKRAGCCRWSSYTQRVRGIATGTCASGARRGSGRGGRWPARPPLGGGPPGGAMLVGRRLLVWREHFALRSDGPGRALRVHGGRSASSVVRITLALPWARFLRRRRRPTGSARVWLSWRGRSRALRAVAALPDTVARIVGGGVGPAMATPAHREAAFCLGGRALFGRRRVAIAPARRGRQTLHDAGARPRPWDRANPMGIAFLGPARARPRPAQAGGRQALCGAAFPAVS